MKTDFDVKYEAGHSSYKCYETADGFRCPNCFKTRVWVELGDTVVRDVAYSLKLAKTGYYRRRNGLMRLNLS